MVRTRNSWLAVAIALCCAPVWGQALRVDKVEPPNWWTGMRWNRLQLMLYGEGLCEISARFEDPRLKLHRIDSVPNPHYAFVEFEIPRDLPEGIYPLAVRRGTDVVRIDYPIRARAKDPNSQQGFSADDVIYLITPDRFANGDPSNDRAAGTLDEYDPAEPGMRHGGDLQGIMDHLDYIRDLGATAIWLNPVLENRGINSYHGYKATDLYRVDPRFGTNELYKSFVDEAHRRGLKVIFDHVNNHIGIRHPWIDDLPTPDWIHGSVDDHAGDKHYLMAITDPHADHQSTRLLKTFWFVDRMPDLNQRNPLLAKYRIQNTLWWIEYTGLDGIREDTYPYVDQDYLARWARVIRDEYPKFNIVGEIWGVKPAFVAQFQEKSVLPRDFETNLPAVMDFPLMEAFRRFLDGTGKLRDIYEVYAQDFLYADPQNLLVFLDNHDTPRGIFIAHGDVRRVEVALTIMLTARGIPQLLYGTEINMLGGKRHIDLRADFPGGFAGHTRDAFTAAGRTDAENKMFHFLRKLLQLRKQHKSLARGRLVHYPPTWNSDVYKFLKLHPDEKVLVIANGHDEPRQVDLTELQDHLAGTGALRDLMTDQTIPWKEHVRLRVPAMAARVYQLIEQPVEPPKPRAPGS